MGRSNSPDTTGRLVLASASPRRAELLRQAGVDVEIRPCPEPEPVRKPASVTIEMWPVCLAHYKASAVRQSIGTRKSKLPTIAVIGADTIVELNGRIINKAASAAHAREILRSLAGRKHRVITGLAVIAGEETHLLCATAVCRMRRLSPASLERYIAGGLWRGKAGAYGIQDADDPLVELVSGDITTVMGLPMPPLLDLLARIRCQLRS